jgi:hypothetical protein
MAADDAPRGGSIAALAERAITIAEDATRTQEKIVAQQGRLRRNGRILAVSLATDIVLSVVCLFLALNQAGVSHSIHQSQLAACAIGNQFRATQTQVWEHVLGFSTAPPGETAAQRAKRLAILKAFQAYLTSQFRPVDCTALYGK